MKVAVLNGSPKGEHSVSLQYVRYAAKHLPEHTLEVVNVGLEAAKMERRPEVLEKALEVIASADCILWCFPVYVLGLPSQLHHFLDLVSRAGREDVFAGKFATTLTTSAHFYDHTAHQLMQALSEDLGMRYLEGFSAAMDDLLQARERERLLGFFADVVSRVSCHALVERRFLPVFHSPTLVDPERIPAVEKRSGPRAVVLTDATAADVSLKRLIVAFDRALEVPLEVISLDEVPMQGGCLGCMQCADDGTCCYKDGFSDFWRERLMTADILVFACRISRRTFSTLWKRFQDRGFFNGHRPVLEGKRIVYLISGPLRQLPAFRDLIEIQTQLSKMLPIGVVSDDEVDGEVLGERVASLARRAVNADAMALARPETFLAVGGYLVFRDLIYGYRAMFRADYRFYKASGLVKYPLFNWKQQLTNLITRIVLWLPGFKKTFYRSMKVEMVKPLKRIVDDPNV